MIDQGGTSEFQPSISPDGTQYCFTIGDFGSNANVHVGTVGSSTQIFLATTAGVGEYNCTWSPDGTLIAYVYGTFSTGELVMERADNTSPSAIPLAEDPGADNFDGNPDWAPDGRPTCEPASVVTPFNTPVSLTLRCPDQGPAYELTPVRLSVAPGAAANGTVSDGVQPSPFTVLYTPNAGFTGTDSFTFLSFDDFGFGQTGTATVRVLLPGNCANLQTGTNASETLTGTVAGDRLRGLGGNDRLNGGDGNDCLEGGAGNDRLTGGAGNDRLVGGKGKNAYLAGLGNDTVRARNGRRETVNCGKGRRDRAVVDRTDSVPGCERVTRR